MVKVNVWRTVCLMYRAGLGREKPDQHAASVIRQDKQSKITAIAIMMSI